MILDIIKIIGLSLTVIFVVTGLILRLFKNRKIATYMELIASLSFVVFSSSLLASTSFGLNFLSSINIMIFVLSLVMLIYKIIFFNKH